ncbi:DUF4396 domain-containing protein [Lentibacillus halophilus]|uniref:DUF4396 domain-containing protein n=1 Tax=Lentibacillus halophilus TaxID=295065 RepID=A0ABN0Z5M0_9BACI
MTWLEVVSWIAIGIGFLQAIIIAIDVIRHPQRMMPVMTVVWPLTGLYFPIAGIWAYYGLGRAKAVSTDEKKGDKKNGDHHDHKEKPFWQSVFVSTTHCSSGCSLGDMIGAPLVYVTGFTIAGITLFADYAVEFVLAYLFGIAFQYYGMGFKKHENPGKALKNAIKADTWSLIAFEVGMFGWMALVHYVFFVTNVPDPDTALFWFMMQLAMMVGFCTSYPVNWWLVKTGIKHAM